MLTLIMILHNCDDNYDNLCQQIIMIVAITTIIMIIMMTINIRDVLLYLSDIGRDDTSDNSIITI